MRNQALVEKGCETDLRYETTRKVLQSHYELFLKSIYNYVSLVPD